MRAAKEERSTLALSAARRIPRPSCACSLEDAEASRRDLRAPSRTANALAEPWRAEPSHVASARLQLFAALFDRAPPCWFLCSEQQMPNQTPMPLPLSRSFAASICRSHSAIFNRKAASSSASLSKSIAERPNFVRIRSASCICNLLAPFSTLCVCDWEIPRMRDKPRSVNSPLLMRSLTCVTSRREELRT